MSGAFLFFSCRSLSMMCSVVLASISRFYLVVCLLASSSVRGALELVVTWRSSLLG